MATDDDDGWPTSEELKSYAAHGPVLEQATAFLTHITTTITLYATVTGAAWVVVSANTLGVNNTTLLWILALHIALSLGVSIGLWGVGNNFIQRLNFARWIGVKGWPHIQEFGGLHRSWSGVPANDQTRPTVKGLQEWIKDKEQAGIKSGLPLIVQGIDFNMRYRAFAWPSLRFQRLWAILPILAGCFSVALFGQIREDGKTRKELCNLVANTLSFRDSAPISRETFERARYLFEKTGCEIAKIDLQKLRSGS
jgi:hypothetical protein